MDATSVTNKSQQLEARSLQPAASSLHMAAGSPKTKTMPEQKHAKILQRVQMQPQSAYDFKIFDMWGTKDIVFSDTSLKDYINFQPRVYPYTFGRFNKRFGRIHVNLIERLATKLMVTGHLKDSRVHKRISGRDTGKKQRNMKIVKHALKIIEIKTKKNPLQVLVQAVENSAPREETTRIRQGGIIVHKSVDIAPQRRLDLSIRFLTHGAGIKCFNKKASLENALADEIIFAANNDAKCYSVSRKETIERIAASAR